MTIQLVVKQLFYASVRLKLTRIKSEFIERPDPVTLRKKKMPFGNVVQVKAVKNKMDGKQGHSGEIFIRYGYGVDEYLSVIQEALPREIITRETHLVYTYAGKKFKGRETLRDFLVSNSNVFEKLKSTLKSHVLRDSFEGYHRVKR